LTQTFGVVKVFVRRFRKTEKTKEGNMIVIVASMMAKAGMENELVKVMKELSAEVKSKEPDTLDYVLLRSLKDPLSFLVYEKYRSPDAMKAHLVAPHFQDAAKKLAGILDGGLKAESYSVVE
jgi:(4S)-4-hydroxy-5-phosphonooxypentane-2,3-dione isomerase